MTSDDGSRPGVKLRWGKGWAARFERDLRRANGYAGISMRESNVLESRERSSGIDETEYC